MNNRGLCVIDRGCVLLGQAPFCDHQREINSKVQVSCPVLGISRKSYSIHHCLKAFEIGTDENRWFVPSSEMLLNLAEILTSWRCLLYLVKHREGLDNYVEKACFDCLGEKSPAWKDATADFNKIF